MPATQADAIAIVMADPSGHITHWSPGATQLFGYTADQALGASLDLIVPAEDHERHWAGFRRAMTTGHGRLEGATANIPVHCQDGSVLAFPGRFGLVRDGHNRVVGALAVWSGREGTEQPWTPTWQVAESST